MRCVQRKNKYNTSLVCISKHILPPAGDCRIAAAAAALLNKIDNWKCSFCSTLNFSQIISHLFNLYANTHAVQMLVVVHGSDETMAFYLLSLLFAAHILCRPIFMWFQSIDFDEFYATPTMMSTSINNTILLGHLWFVINFRTRPETLLPAIYSKNVHCS